MVAWCWAALRSRWVQGVGVCLLVTLVVACAAFTPLYVRSLENSLVRARVGELDLLGRTVTLTSSPRSWAGGLSAAQLRAAVPDDLKAVSGPEVVERRVTVSPIDPLDVSGILVSRGRACDHLRILQGRCSSARDEIVVSAPAAKTLGVRPGGTVRVRQGSHLVEPALEPVKVLTVTGVFAQPRDGYWRGIDVESTPLVGGAGGSVRRQYWFTAASTFTGRAPTEPLTRPEQNSPPATGWVSPETSLELPVDAARVTAESLPVAVQGVIELRSRLGETRSRAQLSEQLTTIDQRVAADRGQAGQIVPLLMVQLGLLLVLALWLVLRSVAQQRRPELALARVRGRGAAGARRLLLGEMALPVAAGLPMGVGCAALVDLVVRRAWLPAGVAGGWSWPAVLAGSGALVVVVAMLLLVTRLVLREPVVSLLRAIPPRRSGARLGLLDVAVVVLAVFGLVALGTGALSGPFALVIPLLAASAAGVLLGVILLPILAAAARTGLAHGRIGVALVAAQLARRPAVRPLLTAVVVSVALLVFSVNAVVLGQHNRQDRAEADLGAPGVMTASTLVPGGPTTLDFIKAVDRVDPRHRRFTPVVKVTSPSPDGPVTLAVRPGQARRIMAAGGLPVEAIPWAALTPQGKDEPLPAIVANWSRPSAEATFSAPLLIEKVGDYHVVGSAAYLPGAGAKTFLTALAPQLDDGALRADAEITNVVWSATTDPGDLARMEQALHRVGFENVTVDTVPRLRGTFDRSASAWGLQLALVVGLAAVVVAILVLLAVLLSSWRLRAADLSALRRAGVAPGTARTSAIGEQLLIVVVGAVVGAVVGVLGARVALPLVPFFADSPAYPVVHTATPWGAVLLASAATLVVLGATAVAGGLLVFRRSGRTGQGAS